VYVMWYVLFSSCSLFLFLCFRAHRDLPSFPTRRSSDLFGYEEKYEYYGGQAFGSQRGDARDTSDVVQWRARFDITSQLNRFMQVKAGVEYLTSDYDVFYGSWDPANPHQENERFRWQRSRSEEHTSELQSRENLVCRLLLE